MWENTCEKLEKFKKQSREAKQIWPWVNALREVESTTDTSNGGWTEINWQGYTIGEVNSQSSKVIMKDLQS